MDEGQMRVEELARRADVSVDTIRFYQKRRLLPPPSRGGRIAWYRAEHVERLGRIRELQRRGFSLAVIRRVLDGEPDPADAPLAAAVAGAVAGTDEAVLLTLDELAARAGVPRPLLEAIVREGLLVPRRIVGAGSAPNLEERFTVADVEIVVAGLRLLEAGFPLPELLALARHHDAATRAVAEDAVRLFDEHVREPLRALALSDDERAERLVAAFRTLLPTVTALVGHHFERVLLEVAQSHLESVGETTELAVVTAQPDWGAA
jgi:DNA-binding transcriptional MerR regulator